jgi:multidrug efflux pump subunit AcrA (membrane-fusion protein)
MKKRSSVTLIAVLIILAVIGYGLYRYGHAVPGLREIPFFQKSHEHTLKPVLTAEGEIDYWTCPMHPSVKMKDPGTCPICGMELTPVMKDTGHAPHDAPHEMEMPQGEGHSGHMMEPQPPPAESGGKPKTEFTVSPERQQLIGVKTVPVTMRSLDRTVRTVGIVVLDETKVERVHTRFSGWVDKLYVNYTFEHVHKGQPLFSIYSPELVATQEEYLIALRSKKALSGSGYPEISSSSGALLQAAERRLRLWDISQGQIDELAKTGKVRDSLVIYSPVSGHVLEKNVFPNTYVEPGTVLYTIADHSNVWVEADIYENEIPLVKVGDEATMTLASLPGREFEGKVTFISPHLDMKTRTAKARLEFPNPDLTLLPEMYADVVIDVPVGERLAVPDSAVLRTGTSDIVFVSKSGGRMEVRGVNLGAKAGGYYEVLGGLFEGELVVSGARFLIDSESRIQNAVASWQDAGEGHIH